MADGEPESAMDVFFNKYKANKANLDVMRGDHPAPGGLSGLLLESPAHLAVNSAEWLANEAGSFAENAGYGLGRFAMNTGAAFYRAKGKGEKAANFAAAAEYLGEARKKMSAPSSSTPKTDDGPGGDGKTKGYDEMAKELAEMRGYIDGLKSAGVYQHPTNQPALSPIRTPSSQQTPANAVPAYLSQIGGFLSQFGGDDLAYAKRLVDYEAVRMGSLEKFGQSLAKPAVLNGTVDLVKNRSYVQL